MTTRYSGSISLFLRSAVLALAVAAGLPAGPARAIVPHEVAIARGIDLINDAKYREALVPLEEAVAAAPQNPEALFYAGLAHARLSQFTQAEALLRRALGIDEAPEVYYELGRIAALTGRCAESERLFDRFGALGGDAAARRDAAGLVDACRARAGALQLALTAGWQHDSNVILDPDRPGSPREAERSDSRALAFFSAAGSPWHAHGLALEARYDFYGSLHRHLDDFNAVYHRLAPSLALTAWESVRPALGYSLEDTRFGGDHYSTVHTGWARVGVAGGRHAATEASAEYRSSDFDNSQLFADNADRSGRGWSAGLRQQGRWRDHEAQLYAFVDRERAAADWWDARGWRAGGRVSLQLSETLTAGLFGEYRAVDYAEPPPSARAAREDRIRQFGGSLSWVPRRDVAVSLSANRTRDRSNLDAYTYARTIWGVLVTVAR